MTYWLPQYSAARNAQRAYDAALAEFKARIERAWAFMQEHGAVLGEACAHVGIGAASEDVKRTRAAFDTATRELLATLAQEIRP
ncbi:MAG TPA: hypothetical protein VLI71_09825 [Gammaproteobacteria bacterium]|nr:hypothetical protein [Gammaproteobacteria bacterium]